MELAREKMLQDRGEQLTEGSRGRQERRRGEQKRGQEKRRKKRTNDTVIVKRRCANPVSSEAF